MSRPRSVGFVLLLIALGAVAGLIIGFVQGYLDLPNSPLPPGAPADDWHYRVDVTGAKYEAVIGGVIGLLAGAAVSRAWRIFIGLVIGALLGLVGGILVAMFLATFASGEQAGILAVIFLGYVVVPTVGATMGFLIGTRREVVARRSRSGAHPSDSSHPSSLEHRPSQP
jgi:tetrahydromethanopterin S-methyltransferase subunit G